MKRLMSILAIVCVSLFAFSAPTYAAQTATGPVTLWSIAETPGFSLISVGTGGDGGGGSSVLCTVDATSVFGVAIMTAAASAAVQGAKVTLTCSDAGQAQRLQLATGSD